MHKGILRALFNTVGRFRASVFISSRLSSALSISPAGSPPRAGRRFRREVVLNPNKSNLTVATPRCQKESQRESERDRSGRRDRSRERVLHRDRNRRGDRGGGRRREARRGGRAERGKKRRIIKRVGARCPVGIRRRRPKAVRVIRDRERRDK